MPKKGRKPGEFLRVKEKHQKLQKIYDAVKEVRETGFSQITWKDGTEYSLKPFDIDTVKSGFDEVLAKIENRLKICVFIDKDGYHLMGDGFCVFTHLDNILAQVIEIEK